MTRLGAELHRWIADLYPIGRSLTGDGVRETLRRLGQLLPLAVREVPSGTRVLDWTVPPEWNLRDAWIENSRGERIVDVRRSTLHVVAYSRPVRARLALAELRPHLFSLPEHPDWIPYRTSYYADGWGFCLRDRQLRALPDDRYEVCIDATLGPGSLTYGECELPGELEDEILVSTHVCHPSLCNDNLSGMVIAAFLGQRLAAQPRRHTYRLLFVPGTIGSITWLALNESRLHRIAHGLVLTCLGDPGPPTYKRSRRGQAPIDRAAAHVLAARGRHDLLDFSPWGYDERQFCSPGFNLPVGCLMRTPHGRFAQYHTSADDLDFVRPDALEDSLAACAAILDLVDRDRVFVNRQPKGEPHLGRRGLYPPMGGAPQATAQLALLWVLNLSDGRHSLLDIAERSGLPFDVVHRAATRLVEHELLREAEPLDDRRNARR
jgi:aminopeptidase-like protein